MNHSPPSHAKALTVIELLVGIAILIVLVGLAIVGSNTARARAYNTQALVCGEQIRKAQTLYYSENQRFADAFDKLNAQMVSRCALVSVVEVTATPQGYTYTVAHQRGNAKYTIEDDRASASLVAGGDAVNGAGAADTSGGGQVVGAPIEKAAGTGSVILTLYNNGGVYPDNLVAPAGLTYRLIHPNGFVNQGVISTTTGGWSTTLTEMPAGEYTLELPYKHVVGNWQSVFSQMYPFSGTCSALQAGVVDAPGNKVTCKTTLTAGQTGYLRLNDLSYATPPLPSVTVMPDDASIGGLTGLYDSSLKYRTAWRLHNWTSGGTAWVGETSQYWNYAGRQEQVIVRPPNDRYTLINVDVATGYASPSWSAQGSRRLEAGRVRMLTSSVWELNAQFYPGNLDYVVKVPMVETTTALVVNLTFPEPLTDLLAPLTPDGHYYLKDRNGVFYNATANAAYGYDQVVSFASWAAPHRTVTGNVYTATYTPTRNFSGVLELNTVNTTGGLVRYVPVGLSNGYYQTLTAARGAPADTVLNVTYKKQTRADAGSSWVDAP